MGLDKRIASQKKAQMNRQASLLVGHQSIEMHKRKQEGPSCQMQGFGDVRLILASSERLVGGEADRMD